MDNLDTLIDYGLIALLALTAFLTIYYIRLKENGFAIVTLMIALFSIIVVAINR